MATRPHLTQIQSSNPDKYNNLMDEIKGIDKEILDVSKSAAKKTVVFYIKRYNEEGQSLSLYIPYRGRITSITAHKPTEEKVLKFKLYVTENIVGEYETAEALERWELDYVIDSPVIRLELLGDEIGIENINVNVGVIAE